MSSIKILRTVQQVRNWRLQQTLQRHKVGFVPTMGALHAGHCSLVSASIRNNDNTVVSIFVNPLQFAPHEDLNSYPRTLDTDLKLLEEKFGTKVDAVFVPQVSEMYPQGVPLEVGSQRGAFVSVLGVSEQLEGVTRPQFFRGVATVVTKLLNVVTPTNLYVGQKDAQQCVVLKNLVRDLLIDTNVNVVPTLREPNGLAMSLRNAYLSTAAKDEASVIYKALSAGASVYKNAGTAVESAQIIAEVRQVLAKKDFEVEYIAVSDPNLLADLEKVEPGVGAIVSTAVRVPKEGGGVARLIDNVVLE